MSHFTACTLTSSEATSSEMSAGRTNHLRAGFLRDSDNLGVIAADDDAVDEWHSLRKLDWVVDQRPAQQWFYVFKGQSLRTAPRVDDGYDFIIHDFSCSTAVTTALHPMEVLDFRGFQILAKVSRKCGLGRICPPL